MSDINTGGEHWGNDWIERVETAAEKYGVECHGVPLNVGWFLNLLDAAVEKERAEAIDEFAESLKSRLGDAIHPQDFESMRNLIDDVRRSRAKNNMFT